MRNCPHCLNTAVIEDGYCGHCRQCTLPALDVKKPAAVAGAARGSARKSFNPWEVYQRWWKGKTTADGMLITDIVWHGPPSGVYGTVELLMANGTSRMVATNKHRPAKYDVQLAPNAPHERRHD